MTTRILTLIGARPQFIKAAAVSGAIRTRPDMKEILVHSGQHYDAGMSQVFFDELELPSPDYNLGVGSGTHAWQTGEIMKRFEEVVTAEKPDMVLVYGDTNSTLAGALTAAKLHVPIAHVEAGLRSFNRMMPEEINRIITDTLSSYLFAPTDTAIHNLAAEGITTNVFNTGDVMYDVALIFGKKAESKGRIIKNLGLKSHKFILATVHRAENTDNKDRLRMILLALARAGSELPVVFPIHPRTRKQIDALGMTAVLKNMTVVDPVGFLDMICLEKNAAVIVTDSGGVQKEAYFHRVPCVTLRDETEWVETLDAGWNVLAPMDSSGNIFASIRESLGNSRDRKEIPMYGNGQAAHTIIGALG